MSQTQVGQDGSCLIFRIAAQCFGALSCQCASSIIFFEETAIPFIYI